LWFKRIASQMIIPLVLIILSVLLIWKWPLMLGVIGSAEKVNAFIKVLPALPYFVYLLGVIMGSRYNNTGLILTSVAMILMYGSISYFPVDKGFLVPEVVSFLFPINLLGFSLITKKRILSLLGCSLIGFILLQVAIVIILFVPASFDSRGIILQIQNLLSFSPEWILSLKNDTAGFLHGAHWTAINNLPIASAAAFFIAMIVFVIRYVLTRDVILSGYLGALVAIFLGFTAAKPIPGTPVYFMVAGLILLFTNIEASFFKAYVDELTGLHGRRSLNETMANLGRKYTIAMMDIDHFKKFNDTYGHKTGDDVLKMVAQKLEKISGGGKTFRYGGEEFTVVFSGKTVDEAIPHLERFRYEIEKGIFSVRSKGRKKGSEGDRGCGGAKKEVRVTISIGVAGPEKNFSSPEKVIKSADKALYKAKRTGRNCVRSL